MIHISSKLLEVHEGNNVLGHIRGMHKIVRGDVTKTAPDFFKNFRKRASLWRSSTWGSMSRPRPHWLH